MLVHDFPITKTAWQIVGGWKQIDNSMLHDSLFAACQIQNNRIPKVWSSLSSTSLPLSTFSFDALSHKWWVTRLNPPKSKSVSNAEILKFLDTDLTPKFEFGSRASLWSMTALHKYIPALPYKKTGMRRQRFNFLFCCLLFGEQPAIRPSDKYSEIFQWKLADAFINN